MSFLKYPKVCALGKSEVQGCLHGTVHVFEKLDGANASIWCDGQDLKIGSRSRDVSDVEFRGFPEWFKEQIDVWSYLVDHPTHRIYGEWLVKHTIEYNRPAYQQFYVFDLWDGEQFRPWDDEDFVAVREILPFPPLLGVLLNPSAQMVLDYVRGESAFGPEREGVVLKNYDFRDKWENQVWAKITSDRFKERNRRVFGDPSKASAVEYRIACQFITAQRIEKMVHKLEDLHNGQDIEEPFIPELMGRVYEDLLQEDLHEILKKYKNPTIDFRRLKNEVNTSVREHFLSYLSEKRHEQA